MGWFRFARRLGAAILLAPLLAFALASSSTVAWRCSMTGAFVTSPCLADEGQGGCQTPASNDGLAQASCCDRVVLEADKPPATLDDGVAGMRPVFLSLPVLSPLALEWPPVRRSWTRRPAAVRPPGSPAPLFLLERSFLI